MRTGQRPVAQLDADNNVVSVFVYATESHVPDYMVSAGVVYRFVTDHLGNVRMVVNASTGEVVQQLGYDEFGNVLGDTNPGFQPFGFAGGLYDADTGLARFGARDYDAMTGRWTAKDPILFRGRSTNLYGYVGNDPINFIDPSGLSPCPDDVQRHFDDFLHGVKSYGEGLGTALAHLAALEGLLGDDTQKYAEDVETTIGVAGLAALTFPEEVRAAVDAIKQHPAFTAGRLATGVTPRRTLRIDHIFRGVLGRSEPEPFSQQVQLPEPALEHQPAGRAVVAEVNAEPC